MTECLFGQDEWESRLILIAFGLLSIIATIGNMVLHCITLQAIVKARSIDIGRRHGKVIYSSSIVRLIGTIIWAGLCGISAGVVMIWLFSGLDHTVYVHQTITLVVCFLSLQSTTSPFLFTLCTGKFVTILKKLFTMSMLKKPLK